MEVKRFAVEFTRSSDVTPYAAQDVVGSVSSGVTEFQLLPVDANDLPAEGLIAGGSYQLKNVKLSKSSKTTTNATFDLYLFSSGVTNAFEDNQEYALLYNQKHVRIGKTAFTLATAGTNNSTCAEATNANIDLTFKAYSSSIYAHLVATAAYTPAASEKFYIEAEVYKL